MSYQEIIEDCFKQMHKKSQEALMEQIKYDQWYRKTFKRILSEKGFVTPEDMEEAYKLEKQNNMESKFIVGETVIYKRGDLTGKSKVSKILHVHLCSKGVTKTKYWLEDCINGEVFDEDELKKAE